MIGDYLEKYTFDYLMEQALSQVPDTIDKRQGSIIYDALAPACYLLAYFYNTLRNIYRDTFAETATGEALDLRAAELGITRYPATFAIKKGYFESANGEPMTIPIGARFSTISDINPITYVVTEAYAENGVIQPGYYQLKCEIAGASGNEYSGTLTNITHIPGLATATMLDLLIPGEDEETDESLRKRYFESLVGQAYGGNIADYKQKVTALPGVGGVKVEPIWNGGGTVKLTIIDSDYNKPSPTLIDEVQTAVDPVQNQGKGYGIAPIGHVVTVIGVNEVEINVEPQITLQTGYTWEDVKPTVEAAINDYFAELRSQWADSQTLVVRISQIEVRILAITGIVDVQNTKLNGQQQNIELGPYEIPILGEVTPQ